ncbi:MAG: phosphate ABC transporter permease subunit PstC [Chloroflexi bacterium]|nr:phosphate ABC transporter permease subunit PstC [Chloroflexota bacterium]MCI0815193.1 phosphate ABC transporter permease subunit PstC [Chloroflexota bacterium]MCI0818625.1 phosphate ABC transporter permease subunit PstC [Chloroflexota bacterium]MCI0820681.1 phosphate ABC transporter permease subunit PstC [Chloroflexota bacterium]MCI0843313.1 phosphate ABC transporter permease subunit PstC [Chloroflexota bacterium]
MNKALKKRQFSRPGESVILFVITLCAAVSLVTTVLIVAVLVRESATFFQHVSFAEFFLETEWQPLFEPVSFGIWELVAGTLLVTFWALVFAVPVGLATAVYLSEYANSATRKVLKPLLEALAGVPTVVYAYFALTFITQDLLRPVFGAEVNVFNALAASIMLAVMILPTIASISEDAMSSVPRDLREAAYGLGATRLEVTIRVVFPAALSGIIAAILLAIARVVGETMIVAIAAGSTPQLTANPLDGVQTMTGFMLQVGLGDAARGTVDYQSLFAVGMMLFLITLAFNVVAHFFVRRYREEYE